MFSFSREVLHSIAGGMSTLDLPRLNIKSAEEARAFILAYGFDLNEPLQLEKLWYFHRRALVMLEEKLGFEGQIPDILRDQKQLQELENLLLWASEKDHSTLQRWSCAILRVMHVFVHAENDLFSSFAEEIQKQILGPFQQSIYHEGKSAKSYLKVEKSLVGRLDPIPLVAFEVKPFKTSSSTVIKLLAKPDALAMNIYDRLGVRFVTHGMFDAFRVVRFLQEETLISFPHIIPDQSSNNLYPVDLFCELAEDLEKKNVNLSQEGLEELFAKALEEKKEETGFFRKENSFSGQDYQFIKFIARKMIRIEGNDKKESFSFFFPFEVQIMDQKAHQRILSGPSHHQAYKERQRQAAMLRALPEV